MKKSLYPTVTMLLLLQALAAQSSWQGTVTDPMGSALIGASIVVKGTPIGTVTDVEGSFSLQVPLGNNMLLVSYTGYVPKEVALDSLHPLQVVLEPGIDLYEIVITGLGIEREKKALSYALQEVEGEVLNPVVNRNVVESLAGKVAGVQVINASGATLGGTSKIRIRGATGLRGGEPLFVVEGTPISNANFSSPNELEGGQDFGSLIQDMNIDDIEDVAVLKGPAATAIYGERGKHGVVMITLKKGRKRQGIGVAVHSSITAESVYILPEYQNEYAGGYTQDWLTDPATGQHILNYAADESWGPRIDGTLYRPWWSWYPGTPEYGQQIPLTAQPNNVRDFFETGLTYNNSIALEGGNNRTTFRLSYKSVKQTGVVPNSKLITNNIGITAATPLTERLDISVNVNFATQQGTGRPEFGYSVNNPVSSFNQWFQRQLDIDRLRDYRNSDGTLRSWNLRSTTNLRPLYWDSPFFSSYENFATDGRDRYFGNIRAKYKWSDDLILSAAIHRDNYTQRMEDRTASGGLEQSWYLERIVTGREDNYEIRLDYNRNFGKFVLDANFGGNIRRNDFHSNYISTTGGLNAPNLFNLSASTDRPFVSSFISEKQVNSIYGAANFGFKNWLYLSGTLRNDWSSALPVADNSYLYPSLGLSLVFSEWVNTPWLSFGKLRASMAQVGSDLQPYQTAFTYRVVGDHRSQPAFTLPNTLINSEIRPALSTSWEMGLELRLFDDRAGLDLTYYKTKTSDEILFLQVPGSSGFSTAIVNAGEMESGGIEATLHLIPVQTRNWDWRLALNLGTNDSRVIALADGLDNYQLGGRAWGGLTVNAPVGELWGQFRGTRFARDEQGRKVINEDGSFRQERNQWLGSFLPDATGGIRSNLQFKGLFISTFLDFQIGGQFHSITRMYNASSGLGLETVGYNDKGNPIRDPVGEGGGIRIDGVLTDGSPHTVYVSPQAHFANLVALHENWLYDQSYIKLRELSIGYSLPTKLLETLPVNSATFSLVGKNLWLIHSNVAGIDPSEVSPGANPFVFQEGGILPGVRSIGVHLKLGF